MSVEPAGGCHRRPLGSPWKPSMLSAKPVGDCLWRFLTDLQWKSCGLFVKPAVGCQRRPLGLPTEAPGAGYATRCRLSVGALETVSGRPRNCQWRPLGLSVELAGKCQWKPLGLPVEPLGPSVKPGGDCQRHLLGLSVEAFLHVTGNRLGLSATSLTLLVAARGPSVAPAGNCQESPVCRSMRALVAASGASRGRVSGIIETIDGCLLGLSVEAVGALGGVRKVLPRGACGTVIGSLGDC